MLNPDARIFQSQKTPFVLMAPIKGVCLEFQFGTCPKSEHHRGSDSLALHICQLCVMYRQEFLDHSCSGGHSNHPVSCGQKKFGAVACPFHIPTLNQNQGQPLPLYQRPAQEFLQSQVSVPQTQENHQPRFLCPCNKCALFFQELQQDLDFLDVNMDIQEMYLKEHFSPTDIIDDDECEMEDEPCQQCYEKPALPSQLKLCSYCDLLHWEQYYEEYDNQVREGSNQDSTDEGYYFFQ